MTRVTLRKVCADDGCQESAFWDFSSQRERREHCQREQGRPWRCTRHSKPNEVLTPSNPTRQVVLTAEKSRRFPNLTKLFWREAGAADVGSGFTFGPGFKAFADDFPEGTRLVITLTIAAPPTDREGVGTGAGEGATGQDTGTAWVTRSADCPEAPAQAHPLATAAPPTPKPHEDRDPAAGAARASEEGRD